MIEKVPPIDTSACPYCMTMLEDGLKNDSVEDKIKVLDRSEIVAKALSKSK